MLKLSNVTDKTWTEYPLPRRAIDTSEVKLLLLRIDLTKSGVQFVFTLGKF